MTEIILRGADSYVESLYEAVCLEDQIILGSDIKRLEHEIFVECRETMFDKFLGYDNLGDFVNDNIENSLTHETLHIIIYRDVGVIATCAFDDVDKNYEISGVHTLQ